MFDLNEYQLALFLGVIFLVLYICVFLFERIWFLLYGFVNESKPTKHSQVMRFFCLRKGYTDRDSKAFWFNKPDGSYTDGFSLFVQYGATLFISPFLCLIAFKLYAITLFLVSATALLFLARFAFRAKKLMNKHITDKDAHKV